MEILIPLIFVWIVCGVITGAVASSKGRDGLLWGWVGFFLGPLGILIVSVISEVKEASAAVPQMQSHAQPDQTSMGDIIDQLDKLDGLRARGVLTQGEFENQKARILGNEPAPLVVKSSSQTLPEQL